MGNDLTGSGWEWLDEDSNSIILRLYDLSGNQIGFELQVIPYYSTTWEGAGLVMEWLDTEGMSYSIKNLPQDGGKIAYVNFCAPVKEESAPLALAKAYISAMEERDNGN
jgi:hypothetical protein